MANYTTAADVKTYLGVGYMDDDPLLTTLIAAVSGWFDGQTDRSILTGSCTDARSGDDSRILVLREYPVTAVASVTVDGAIIPEATTWDADGWVRAGRIVLLRGNYRFTLGVNNVVVVYTAGYASTPADVAQAVIEMVALKYRERQHVGTQTEAIAGQSLSYLPAVVPQSVQGVVNAYRRLSF